MDNQHPGDEPNQETNDNSDKKEDHGLSAAYQLLLFVIIAVNPMLLGIPFPDHIHLPLHFLE